MFDGSHDNAKRPSAPDASVDRLCALYDGLLAGSGGTLEPAAEAELKALAKIFDLDADRPAQAVWRDVRAVVVRQAPSEDAPQPPTRGVPLTILLVEDDPETAADLMEALNEAGHNVIGPFHNAEAAEVSAALHSIDLALLDINLSGATTGVDLARSLKSRWGMPVIFLSGDVTAAARNAELAAAMVIKPYSGRDVLDAINRLDPDGKA